MNKLQTGSVYPWQTELERFIEQVESAPNRVNDGWTHQHKLVVLEKLVRAYALHQDDTGAIIDPHSESERYYSTPSYALAAAVLVKEGRHDLLESAAAALTHSIACVVEEKAPDHHPDFFPIMMMGAYRLLKNLLPEQATAWKQQLSRIQPEQTYIFTMSKMKNPNRMINWNAIMISGEFLRAAEGIAADSEWMETYIRSYHLPRFTGLGLYQDGPLDRPNSPFAYDIVTRFHLGVMLENGYDGSCALELRDHLRRGRSAHCWHYPRTGKFHRVEEARSISGTKRRRPLSLQHMLSRLLQQESMGSQVRSDGQQIYAGMRLAAGRPMKASCISSVIIIRPRHDMASRCTRIIPATVCGRRLCWPTPFYMGRRWIAFPQPSSRRRSAAGCWQRTVGSRLSLQP